MERLLTYEGIKKGRRKNNTAIYKKVIRERGKKKRKRRVCV
jgi:hypothetical protein